MKRRVLFPRPLQYLMAIAEHGNFTRAAKALHVSQPSLSQQIKQLEESMGAPLLVRSGRTVTLTNAGEIYLHHARRALGELNAGIRAIQEVQDLSRGSLQVGWTPITDYLACSLLEVFHRRYPGIRLNTLEMTADNIELAVAEERVDVGIAFSRVPSSKVGDNEIRTTHLFSETLCFAVGSAHPRAGQKERLGVQEFGKETLVALNPNFALRRKIDSYCLTNAVLPHIAIETDSLSVIIQMVQNSPYGTKSIVQTQCGIHPINLVPNLPTQSISLLTRAGSYLSPATVAFAKVAVDWAVDRIAMIPPHKLKPCPLSDRYYQEQKNADPQ